ncbi:MAG: hypothetical protein JO067_02360 [Cupriavidus sp.]|nr:hypothetical protein [Cupriavidus sp.]
MDLQPIWIILLSVSTPIAGVVGFAIQLRQVTKARLENEKLQLEIAALRAKAAEAQTLIQRVTLDEVEKYTRPDIMFSMRDEIPVFRSGTAGGAASAGRRIADRLFAVLLVLGLLLFAAYFVYDLYRLATWLGGKLHGG